MPSASSLIAALAAPLHELRATLGTGTVDGTGPALDAARGALAEISGAVATTSAGVPWTGRAADAAAHVTRSTVEAIAALAERVDRLGSTATAAADAVARARTRIDAIIEEFEARAAALAADPDAATALADEARTAQDAAEAVVRDLTGELDARAAAVQTPDTHGAPAQSPPANPTTGWTGLGSAAAGVAPAAASGLRSMAGSTSGGPGMQRPRRATATPNPDAFGTDTAVHLPGGATASAPNAIAAGAVRHALTQLGVPYDWGGTTPGVGLDCSGLTQWAYREAGLDIPRLAQEQDVGAAVSRDALRPGDLAVWDGHVAMIVGDGVMVEAGDPVQLSPIRTTNAGQGFQGFWRPTA